MGTMLSPSTKLLFFVTEDWYFCSHRLPLAIAARENGYDVYLYTRVAEHRSMIEEAGVKVISSTLQRRSLSPLREMREIIRIVKMLRRVKPDILHNVALKPVLYGSIASFFLPHVKVINALAGLGYVYTSGQLKSRLLRPVITTLFRLILNRARSKLILQNPDDRELFISKRIVARERIRLIKGSGISLERFTPQPEPEDVMTVVLASRMLWDKGIGEFVDAARQVKKTRSNVHFVLVGKTDSENPSSIPASRIRAWETEGCIEWWGHREDIPEVFAGSNIVCLPSYREGLPRVLIEAAASGRAIVTTDTPGCREIVRNGENGILVPVRGIDELVVALDTLIEDGELRKRMGIRGRQIVENEYSIDRVVADTLALYQEFSE